ncbi:MAG: electron transport complex subunit RsxC [Oscillospiraceae bacterium]|nr:electron transport complex subunit RsxC [Oscillospiraceae bacterium]
MLKLNGVKLSHYKNSKDAQTVDIPLPPTVTIPLLQHMGAGCEPVVAVGDTVKVGQLIGDSSAGFSVPVHSSVAGTVTAIGKYVAASGKIENQVTIEVAEVQETIECGPVEVTDQASLVAAARAAGLAGLGGAGFPTHIKLAYKDIDKVDTLVINGAECEPYITSDYREMMECPDDIIAGVELVKKCLGIEKAYIGIEDNKPDAIALLKSKAGAGIEVKSLPSLYPQGAEKVLIYNCTGRIVEEGELPADKGIIVMNITTVASLWRYVKTGMPLTHKRITLDGSYVKKPMNVRVPIGTSIAYVLDWAKIPEELARKILMGGPMMGMAVYDLNAPIIKNNNAILVLDEKAAVLPRTTACIRCGRCIDACPMNLMPTLLEKAYDQGDADRLREMKVNLCINCGCCTYVCPAKRHLAQKNTLAKGLLRKQ